MRRELPSVDLAGARRWLLAVLLVLACAAAARAAPAAEGWVGTWAMELRLASTSRIPLLGSDATVTRSLLLVEMERTEQGLLQHHTVCEARMQSSSALVEPLVPQAFVRGMPARSSRVLIEDGPGGSRYFADLGPEAIGFDPDLTRGRLPARAEDRGVTDSDADGQPGSTIELRLPLVGRVRIFIAQSSHLVLRGQRTGPGRVEGEVEILQLEQSTLGADPSFFARTPHLTPDPGRSGFSLERVTPGTTCEQLRASWGDMFAGRETAP